MRTPDLTTNVTRQHITTILDEKTQVGYQVSAVPNRFGFQAVICQCMAYAKKGWCPHVKKVVLQNLDAKTLSIWPLVPIFEEPSLFIPCVLEMKDSPLIEVYALWGGPRISAHSTESEGGSPVGFIEAEVDGRGAIRTLMLSWLYGQGFAQDLLCASSMHSYGKCIFDGQVHRAWSSEGTRMEILRRVAVDTYQILDTGNCRWCEDILQYGTSKEA